MLVGPPPSPSAATGPTVTMVGVSMWMMTDVKFCVAGGLLIWKENYKTKLLN